DRLVHRVARDPHRPALDDSAQREHGHLGRPAAESLAVERVTRGQAHAPVVPGGLRIPLDPSGPAPGSGRGTPDMLVVRAAAGGREVAGVEVPRTEVPSTGPLYRPGWSTAAGSRVLQLRSESTETGECIVAIEDSGPGIEPETLKRIFEPFFTSK